MGTGGGKSLNFVLPAASCPGGVTVVVVPLVSLQGDLIQRCRKMKIACVEWRSDQSPGPALLAFVMPESAMTKRLHDYVEGLRVMAQLDGFVRSPCQICCPSPGFLQFQRLPAQPF
ncbi:hypothetical protein DER45DRAFT_495028 [Fusarium avenaceum]|nr:hypothetical protein DER45DRAFT_495028 [Fusarium avenaceum]